jgi:hypothetical protein
MIAIKKGDYLPNETSADWSLFVSARYVIKIMVEF